MGRSDDLAKAKSAGRPNGSVRLASVGLGWWGKVLANAALENGALLAGCYARTAESREEFASQYDCETYDTYEALLQSAEVDGILLATPHSTHARLIIAAARAGKHVFVEKPFTLDVKSATDALEAAERAGTVLQVGHNKRRQPANREIKRLLDSGSLGTVVTLEGHQYGPAGLGYDDAFWRADADENPLGSFAALGVHMVDTMCYFVGRIGSVQASSKSLLDRPAIDHVTALILEFESGPLGYLGTSLFASKATTITVRGTEGTAVNSSDGKNLEIQRIDDPAPVYRQIEVLDTVADEIGEFIAAIRGETTPETGGAEGLEVAAVLEAAVASASSGRRVEVAEFR